MQRKDPKKDVLPDALEGLKAKIWDLPHLDRVNLLACSVIDHEREAYAASSGLVALASHMAEGYSTANKIRLAEFLRSTADVLDHSNETAVFDFVQRD